MIVTFSYCATIAINPCMHCVTDLRLELKSFQRNVAMFPFGSSLDLTCVTCVSPKVLSCFAEMPMDI